MLPSFEIWLTKTFCHDSLYSITVLAQHAFFSCYCLFDIYSCLFDPKQETMHGRTNPESFSKLAQRHKPEVHESLLNRWARIFLNKLPSSFPIRTQQIWKVVFRSIAEQTHKFCIWNWDLSTISSTRLLQPAVLWAKQSRFGEFCWSANKHKALLTKFGIEKKNTHTQKSPLHKPLSSSVLSLYFPSFCCGLHKVHQNPSGEMGSRSPPGMYLHWHGSLTCPSGCPYPLQHEESPGSKVHLQNPTVDIVLLKYFWVAALGACGFG